MAFSIPVWSYTYKRTYSSVILKLIAIDLSLQLTAHSNRAWNQSVKEQLTPGIRFWSWRKNSTTTAISREGGELRSPTLSFFPRGRSRSGFRTDA